MKITTTCTRLIGILALGSAWLPLCSSTTHATPVEYHFTGKILRNASNVFSEAGLPGIAVGDSFTGKMIFENSATDFESHASIGKFSMVGPPFGDSLIQMQVNGLTFSSGLALSIVTNNDIFSRDSFSMLSLGIGLPTGWSVDNSPTKSSSFTLSDSSQTAFSTDALPTSLDLGDFNTKQVRFSISEHTGSKTVTLNHPGGSTTYTESVDLIGKMETLTLVPEPSGITLATVSLLGLLGFRRRRSK